MSKMVRKGLLSVVTVGAASLTTTGYFACFPVFADGPVDIEIVEVVDDGAGGYKAWEDIVGAMPGLTYSAIPRIKNNGLTSVEVWMCLSGTVTNSSGEVVSLPARAFGINVGEYWVLDPERTVDPSDPASGNCYKYNSVVEAGAVTEPLFSEVTLSSTLENEHQGATFGLHLDAGAVEESHPVLPADSATTAIPDTGENTAIKNFMINASLIFLTAGVLAFFVTIIRRKIHWIRRRG